MPNVDENVTITTFEEENNDVNNDVDMTTSEPENNEIKSLEEHLEIYKKILNELNELQLNETETITKLGLQIFEDEDLDELWILYGLKRIIDALLSYYKSEKGNTYDDEVGSLNSELSHYERRIDSTLVKNHIKDLVNEIEHLAERDKIYSKLEDRVIEYTDLKSSKKNYFKKDNLVESIQSNYDILKILKSIIESLNEYCSLEITLHNNPFVNNQPTKIDTISVNNMSTKANDIINNSPILKEYVNSGSIEGINLFESVDRFAVDLINFNKYILAKGFGDVGGPLTTLKIVDDIKKKALYRKKKNTYTDEDEYEMAPPNTPPGELPYELEFDNIKYDKCVNPIRVVLDTGDYNAFLNLLLFAKCNSSIFNNVLIVSGATLHNEDNIIAFRTGDNKDVLSSKKNGKLKNEKKYEFMAYLINFIRESFSVNNAGTGVYNGTPDAKTNQGDPNQSSTTDGTYGTEYTVQSPPYISKGDEDVKSLNFDDDNSNMSGGTGGRKSHKPKFTRRKNKKSSKRKTIKKRKMPKRKNKTRRNK